MPCPPRGLVLVLLLYPYAPATPRRLARLRQARSQPFGMLDAQPNLLYGRVAARLKSNHLCHDLLPPPLSNPFAMMPNNLHSLNQSSARLRATRPTTRDPLGLLQRTSRCCLLGSANHHLLVSNPRPNPRSAWRHKRRINLDRPNILSDGLTINNQQIMLFNLIHRLLRHRVCRTRGASTFGGPFGEYHGGLPDVLFNQVQTTAK